MVQELNADYVIIGSGAVGMAFADIIVEESDASILIIDRYAKPGGHWNLAYPFVQLHQPSSYYGVSSRELSGGRIECGGLNDGLNELASGAEVSAYFDDVMRHQFLPSGRVQYYPMCNYLGENKLGDNKVVSMVSGKEYQVSANRKMVDATWLNTSVPLTHKPNFDVEDGVRFMPLNHLPQIQCCPDGYVVIGAGKTGIDACLWLLEHHVVPEKITWIVSREAWLLNRRNAQLTMDFFDDSMGTQAEMTEQIAQSESPEDMFNRLEKCGYFLRIDENVTPEMFHAATVSELEIQALRRIKNVVRMGHVTSVGPNSIQLQQGRIATTPNTVHVDCSASAVKSVADKPIFQGDLITPQLTRPYQPVFSAALTAHVELNYQTEDDKNRLCGVVPLPNSNYDFIRFTAASLMNQYHWSQDKPLRRWISNNRLDGGSTLLRAIDRDDSEKWAVVKRIQQASPLAAMKLQEFLSQ